MGHHDVHHTEDESKQMASSTATQPPRKSNANSFLKSWAWKREHRPDRDRFELPYNHKLNVGGKESIMTIKQRPFKTTGFASTVWDSAIVLSKYIERWPALVTGKRCLELGAGCGLPGIVSASLGAKEVVLTDSPDNLPLLRTNAAANQVSHIVSVEALVWGSQPGIKTAILLAYGRNRQAEEMFRAKIAPYFVMEKVADAALDEQYQCIDVDVYHLQLKAT